MLNAQVSPSLSADDVKAFRQALADRDFYKASFEESERQKVAVGAQRDGWKALYEAEKLRADSVQGGRVAELQAEVKDVRTALQIAKDQAAADKQKLGEQNAEIANLKSSRKWYFGAGAVAGAAATYFITKNKERIIQVAQTGFAPPPSRYNFGAKFSF